jgi:hypothetical protein
MTKEKAIEAVARAVVEIQTPGHGEQWQTYPTILDFAQKLVVALNALGLLKLDER